MDLFGLLDKSVEVSWANMEARPGVAGLARRLVDDDMGFIVGGDGVLCEPFFYRHGSQPPEPPELTSGAQPQHPLTQVTPRHTAESLLGGRAEGEELFEHLTG